MENDPRWKSGFAGRNEEQVKGSVNVWVVPN